MQVSYYSALTKIQKLQNLKFKKKKKKKKKKLIFVPTNTPDTGQNTWNQPVQPVFKPVWNVDVSVLVWYIPTVLAGMVRYRPPWSQCHNRGTSNDSRTPQDLGDPRKIKALRNQWDFKDERIIEW